MPAPRTRHRLGLLVLGGWLVIAIGSGESHAADPGAVVVDSGTTLSPGASPGTLTLSGSVTLGSGGNYNWQMLSATGTAGSTTSWDLVNVIGPLAVASTAGDPFFINLWTLSGVSPDVSGSAANFNSASNYSWKIFTASGGISGFAAGKFRLTTSATNGTGGFANAVGTGTFSIAQSGSDLNLLFTAGAPPVITITVASGTQTQAQAGYPTLSGSIPVVKAGGGTLVLDQANPLTGTTRVQGGRLRLANASALASSSLAVVAGGTAQVAGYLATSVAGLNLSGTGLVDVTNGSLTVASGLSASALVAQLLAGRNGGSWDGGSGITSSVAAAAVAASDMRAVGWLDNGDGSVTAAYAAPGDTNLDWLVDVLDASNFAASGKYGTDAAASWSEGDFNYDGVVDVLDAADFAGTGLYGGSSYNSPSGIAAVPEPAVAAAGASAMVAGLAAFWRRRGGSIERVESRMPGTSVR
ncbi:MAG: hypothetical protein FJ286_08090 [Planctomycetes bacterium]|nr:hypothetical protein [Planctomycetota bacterium]